VLTPFSAPAIHIAIADTTCGAQLLLREGGSICKSIYSRVFPSDNNRYGSRFSSYRSQTKALYIGSYILCFSETNRFKNTRKGKPGNQPGTLHTVAGRIYYCKLPLAVVWLDYLNFLLIKLSRMQRAEATSVPAFSTCYLPH
jgi:hypothetical protein